MMNMKYVFYVILLFISKLLFAADGSRSLEALQSRYTDLQNEYAMFCNRHTGTLGKHDALKDEIRDQKTQRRYNAFCNEPDVACILFEKSLFVSRLGSLEDEIAAVHATKK